MNTHHRSHISALILLLALAFGSTQLNAAPGLPVALQADPSGEPRTLITDKFDTWTLGGGFVYWVKYCTGMEGSTVNGYVRRMPVQGGPVRTLLNLPASDCRDIHQLTADDSGLYYFRYTYYTIDRIERMKTGDPDHPITIATIGATNARTLTLDGDFVYWSRPGQLMRAAKTGGTGAGTVVMATTGDTNSLLVRSGQAYWLDAEGLWRAPVGCAAPPCGSRELLASTQGYGIALAGDRLFWVQHYFESYDTPFTVRRISLSDASLADLYTRAVEQYAWVGDLSTDGTRVFWKESFPTENAYWLRAVLATGGNVGTYVEGITSYGDEIFAHDLGIYYHDYANASQGTLSIKYLPANATAISHDLALDAWEVTQAIQSPANDVSLVVEKPTFVRVYPRQLSGPVATNVELVLYGTRKGLPLPGSPLQPLNGTRSVKTGGSYDRANVNDGWLFQLPRSWVAATGDASTLVELRAVVDPRGRYSDPQMSNNVLTKSFTFGKKAPVCVATIPVRTEWPQVSADSPMFQASVETMKQLWPASDVWIYPKDSDIAELETCWQWGFIPYPCFGPYELPEDTGKVLFSLWMRDQTSDDPDECDDKGARTHYTGLVPSQLNTQGDKGEVLGTAWTNFDQAWVKLPPDGTDPLNWHEQRLDVLAHELGHNAGRAHVDCGGAPDPDSNYPYPPCQIGNIGANQHYGFNVRTQEAIAPDAARDLMTYGNDPWVSAYTWKGLYESLADQPVIGTYSAPNSFPAATSVVLVGGIITATLNKAELHYAWAMPPGSLSAGIQQKWQNIAAPAYSSELAAETAALSYHLRLLAADGSQLDDRQVTLVDDTDTQTAANAFMLSFAAPTRQVARLDLLQGTTVLASLLPGSSTPTVSIVQPAGGEQFTDAMTISWDGSDGDSADKLRYNIQYSPNNGSSWYALAADIPHIASGTRVKLTLASLDGLPGSLANQGRIQLIASDGYNTATAISQPFTIANRPPRPLISSPLQGHSYPAGSFIRLQGGAMDAEEGAVSNNRLSWSLDGSQVATGEQAILRGLAPGSHTLSLTAEDTSGQKRTTAITLQIAPLHIPLASEPVLDGICEDAAYANASTVQLSPYPDGSQASVHLIRSSSDLWACFTGMQHASDNSSIAGLHVDVDNSRNSQAQANDYAFLVSEDGTPSTQLGNATGGFVTSSVEGLVTRVSASTSLWNAELRIPASLLNGWNHAIGLDLVQTGIPSADSSQHWPYAAASAQPNSWANTVPGEWPQISSLAPASATRNAAAFTLTVNGTNFVQGATLRWDGTDRPTTFISSTQLQATISTSDLATARIVPISVANPGMSSTPSTSLDFAVNNPVPVLTGAKLSSAVAGSSTQALIINGQGFVSGSVVLWNGTEYATTLLSDTQLRAEIDQQTATTLYPAQITVFNPGPGGGRSNSIVLSGGQPRIMLPLIRR